MIKTLTKHGNSLALVIDKPVLELLSIQQDTELEITTDGHALIIEPARSAGHKEKLSQAMKEVNAKFSGEQGTLALFGDSITVSRAFWFGLQSNRRNASAGMAKAFELVNNYMLKACWDRRGPEYGNEGKPVIFIYDAYEGGIGISEKLYSVFPELNAKTIEMVESCDCEIGCPSCVYSNKCGNNNSPIDKSGSILLMQQLT